MTDMLAWVVSSSILILVILAVRALGKNRLSCRARYCLWLLVLVRLLVPVQLFTTSWGVRTPPLPEHMTEKQFFIPQGVEPAGLPAGITPAFDSDLSGAALPNTAPETAETRPTPEAAYQWSAADVLRAVYLVGAGLLALVLLVSNLRFARRLRRARIPYDALCGGMRVYVAEGLASPCLVGVLRPSVYLTPEATRDERTLRHVLAHETTHRIHGDCVWSLLRLAALCLHWYNPLVWLAVVVSKRDGELACDEHTLARLGEDERTAYGETLLSLVRTRPSTRELLSASTAMTAGKQSMRERIETIARHPRTKVVALLLALAVLLTATAVAFSRSAAKAEDSPRPGPDATVNEPSEARGAYASVEDYLEYVRTSQPDTMTYHRLGPGDPVSYEAETKVLDVRIENLKQGVELSGLAPEGTLEMYGYDIMYKMDVPYEEIVFAGAVSEDGEYVSFEYAKRTLVTLRYADGSVDVLLDEMSYDDMGGVRHYEDTPEEALYDWYVKEKGLDLPLYTVDLLPYDELGNHPARRVDGNGWYFYLPVQAWYRADDGETMRWYSKYNTGSAITVTYLHETIVDAAERYQSWGWTLTPGSVPRVEHTSGAHGNVHTTIRFYDDVHDYKKSGCWQVLTQYDTDALTDYSYNPYIAQEPEVLKAMARSFTIDARLKAPAPTKLTDFVKRLNDEKPIVTLRLLDNETGMERDPYYSDMLPNDPSARYILEHCSFTPVDNIPVGAGDRCIVTIEALGCQMAFYSDNYVQFWPGNGTSGCFVEERYDDLLNVARMWYDEAELNGLGGGYGAQNRIVVPDRGQTYLEAAQEHCDTLLDISLRVSPGSAFRYTWMQCVVEPAEEQTELFRENGEIAENQWAFRMTEIFVPENEAAYNYGMAGNTMDYDEYVRDYAPEEYDPDVPEGACICWRVGYVTKEADGYHTELVGTGW